MLNDYGFMQSVLREVKCEPSDPKEVSGTELRVGTFEETHLRAALQARGLLPLSQCLTHRWYLPTPSLLPAKPAGSEVLCQPSVCPSTA